LDREQIFGHGGGRVWLPVGLLALIAWLAGGYQVYSGNQALQIPLVEKLLNPALFPHDPFAATLKYYSAPIWWGIAGLARFLPLEPLLFLLFLLEKALLVFAAASLAGAFFPKARLAPWAGALVVALGIPALLGSEGKITANYFEQTAASVPFFLLAFAALIKGKPWAWAIYGAIGNSLNPMYGLFALGYSALGFCLLHRSRLKQWLAPLLLSALGSFPAFFFAAASSRAEASDRSLWLSAAFSRFSNHLAPLSWRKEQDLAFALLLALVLAVYFRTRRSERPNATGFVGAAMIAGLVWLALAFVAYFLGSPRLLILHPARATDLWYGISAIFLAGYFAEAVEFGPLRRQWVNLFGLLLALFLFRSLELSSYLFIVITGILLLLPALPFSGKGKPPAIRRLTAALLIITFAFAGGWQLWMRHRTGDWQFYTFGSGRGEKEVALWAKSHTSQDSLFVVPVNMAMFRALAERGVAATWKDGSAILWHRPFVSEWAKRMQALGRPAVPREAARGSFPLSLYPKGWQDEDLRQLAGRYGVEYCVLPVSHKTGLPVVFRGREGFEIAKVGK
jgi:hypothetical protein